MTESSPLAVALIATAVFLLAGLIKGVVGLGLPTVAMALLALVMHPAQAAALLIAPSLVTNLLQLRPLATIGPLARRLAPMQAGVVLGSLGGAMWLGGTMGPGAVAALGGVLMVYAAWGLLGVRVTLSGRTERWLGSVVGVITGLVTAATGVFVVPAVPYLQALDLSKDELVQAMGISFTVSTAALGVALFAQGLYSTSAVASSMLMLLPAVAGMAVGRWVRALLSPAMFKALFFLGLGLLGLYMATKS
ncbi:sulfite exporter TauE/SafE family protein [Aquabacterium sp. CECT 9606]|uniref:sulfite exporter TauE/SafE family protein n=1 Tax=Aquabacterium sp. CECT 9606 TaxID=2845822 RepID=UPI001E5F3635|nr:sulfite exporter TauE/SafE family protein [Aquabacterium sp. CECT 9606]CAH0347884.1 hypothetical protein AQB9606_00103 [Aquabacterium sp. CECT 9606]